MRRLSMLLLVALCLLPDAGPAQAQASPDQMNKLSLEALTTPAPGGNPGSTRHRAYQRSFYRGIGRSHRSFSYGRRVSRTRARYHRSGPSYHPRGRFYGRARYSRRAPSYHPRSRYHAPRHRFYVAPHYRAVSRFTGRHSASPRHAPSPHRARRY